MKELKILLTSLVLVLSSCNNDNNPISTNSLLSNEDGMETCTFDWINSQNNLTSKPGAAIVNWPRWEIGQIVKIKFLDGESWQHELVKKYVGEWAKYANLTFEYVPKDQYAHIRIGFDIGIPGAWSKLGRSSGSETSSQTMRLGPLKVEKEEWAAATILHEFGHALGLHHETQNPAANIKWNFPKAYKYYSEIMGWSKEETDRQVINKESSTNYSEYDPLSIMHYYIPASITTNGVGVSSKNELSIIDRESINKWYPFPTRSIINSGERIDFIPWVQSIKSPNEKYQLIFFHAGSLCIFDLTDNTIIWQVGDTRYSRQSCKLEVNGNLILIGQWSAKIGASRQTIWASNTSEYPGATLHLQDDGSLVLIYNGATKWSSKLGKL